ncbi:hypothetical protein Tco_1576782, partial [Tanacetum coccineum]
MSTPMVTERLDADLHGTPIDQMTYRLMIGGLMYLTVSISRTQTPGHSLCYFCMCTLSSITYDQTPQRGFGVELIAYSDADHAGCKDDCKSTSGGLQFLGGYSSVELEFKETRLVPLLFLHSVHILDKAMRHPALLKERFEYLAHRPSHWYEMYDSILLEKSDKVIIMAQQQHEADVHPDELCPPNKRYDLMDANKKVDLEHVTIFHLPQTTDNNHNSFVPPPSFSNMVPFYKQVLGFTMELKTSSSFKTTGLLQPCQTLCKIFSKCLTTRVTGWDQPSLQIMQMMYCFFNNIHVDYAELLWEGLYYSLHHPTSSIPYPRFTKIIVSHYMTIFPDISRRARDKYHNLQDDDIMKNIFNSGRHKDKVGMQIQAWMITKEMKHTEHYRMTPSAPRSPNPNKEAAESSALRRSIVIHLRIPERRSTRLTPPAPVPNVDKADEMILQDTLHITPCVFKSLTTSINPQCTFCNVRVYFKSQAI